MSLMFDLTGAVCSVLAGAIATGLLILVGVLAQHRVVGPLPGSRLVQALTFGILIALVGLLYYVGRMVATQLSGNLTLVSVQNYVYWIWFAIGAAIGHRLFYGR